MPNDLRFKHDISPEALELAAGYPLAALAGDLVDAARAEFFGAAPHVSVIGCGKIARDVLRVLMADSVLPARGGGLVALRYNVCGGDEKKMLRYQNKYRNLLKKQPETVRAAARRLGVPAEPPAARPPRLLCRRLEGEIDALYERIGAALRAENERLREEIGRLCEENEILRRAAGAPCTKGRPDGEGKG